MIERLDKIKVRHICGEAIEKLGRLNPDVLARFVVRNLYPDASPTCSSCGDVLSPSTLDGLCPQCVGQIIFAPASADELAAVAKASIPASKSGERSVNTQERATRMSGRPGP